MSVYKPARSRFWQYDFVQNGRRFHGSTGQETRRAAEAVGCSYTHLAHTITGRRDSQPLLKRLNALPQSTQPYRESGFARRQPKA